MRLYLEAARLSYRRHRTYRAANVSGILTNSFFGILRSYVFLALYQGRPVAEGYDLGDALTYVWVTQALIMPVILWGWQEIALSIRSGDVVSDLSKPFSYLGYWLARDLGRAAYHVLYRSVPTVLVGLVLFGIRLPADPATWLWFALSLLLAVLLGFCIRFLINLGAFWMTDVRGVSSIGMVVVNFLSGFLVPLEFFPPALRQVVEALPFAGMISVPLSIYLGHAAGTEAMWLLLRQAVWAGVFLAGGQLVLQAATRKLVVQGG